MFFVLSVDKQGQLLMWWDSCSSWLDRHLQFYYQKEVECIMENYIEKVLWKTDLEDGVDRNYLIDPVENVA